MLVMNEATINEPVHGQVMADSAFQGRPLSNCRFNSLVSSGINLFDWKLCGISDECRRYICWCVHCRLNKERRDVSRLFEWKWPPVARHQRNSNTDKIIWEASPSRSTTVVVISVFILIFFFRFWMYGWPRVLRPSVVPISRTLWSASGGERIESIKKSHKYRKKEREKRENGPTAQRAAPDSLQLLGRHPKDSWAIHDPYATLWNCVSGDAIRLKRTVVKCFLLYPQIEFNMTDNVDQKSCT